MCNKLVDLINFKEDFIAKLPNDFWELDDVAKLCSGHERKT